MKLNELLKGLDVGEIGQFSSNPKPHGWWIFKVTPEPYSGPALGSEIPGEFLRWKHCAKCEEIHYDWEVYKKDQLLLPSKEETDVCWNCGSLHFREVIGMVLYVVSQTYAPRDYADSSHRVRIKGFEIAEK